MSKNQKLLIAAVLLIVFAAAKLLLLDWWQRQQSKANVVECSLTQGCVLPGQVQKCERPPSIHMSLSILWLRMYRRIRARSVSVSV